MSTGILDNNKGNNSCQIFSQEVPQLLRIHLEHLLSSAISIDVIKERGYKSVLGKKELSDLSFPKVQCRTPAVLMPVRAVDRRGIANYQSRPDFSRSSPQSKIIKYETVE